MLKHLERYVDIVFLKEDSRKLGINLITAGVAGLFITHIAGLTLVLMAASVWVIVCGTVMSFFGLYKQKRS